MESGEVPCCRACRLRDATRKGYPPAAIWLIPPRSGKVRLSARRQTKVIAGLTPAMSLPKQFPVFALPIKWYLASYRACSDCKYAIDELRNERVTLSAWKVKWAGICSLLRASIHLMRAKDAKSCMPKKLRDELIAVWHRIGNERTKHKIYWEFIYQERNNILKEYDFSAYAVVLAADGSVSDATPTLFRIMSEGEKEALILRGGAYAGRLALDVASEAAQWIEETLLSAIKAAGYDPEQNVISEEFIPPPTQSMLSAARTQSDVRLDNTPS